ncbi:hypothetical protein WJX81_002685 [Elliptochloris bilobata]|uniref:WLM domain-containing protein n=1 Tax=Elliptochloris bilobata TaxID=381761 RepID=A0AAW1SKX3_9CHLO
MGRFQGLEPKDPHKVWDTKTLGKKDDATAWKLLKEVTRQVQPIMRKHCWRVPLVTEFFPNNAGLLGLNVNRGQVIKLRLRSARSGDFLHHEQVLGTMLHELCHNEHGPHNAVFYKLLDEITAECDDFRARGIVGTGAGFDKAPAGKVGGAGFGAHNPDPSQLRDKMLKAAAVRARTGTLMGGGRGGGGAAGARQGRDTKGKGPAGTTIELGAFADGVTGTFGGPQPQHGTCGEAGAEGAADGLSSL